MADVPERWCGTPAEPYWFNPEACIKLIAEHGSILAAARVIGVTDTILGRWASPEKAQRHRDGNRRYERRKRLTDPEWVERRRGYYRRRYESMPGPKYNKMLLRIRRWNGLQRMKKRNRRREKEA